MSIKVLLRCRPFNERELLNNAPLIVTCNESARTVSVSVAAKQVDRSFTFDEVFGPNAQQGDLYDQAVIPIVNEVLEGFNCTIFAYGQTGTGKTYTMEGDCKRSKGVPSEELPRGSGVIPRAVKQIFDTLEGQNAKYSVKVTFLELYNEEITDLLALDDHEKQYTVMEDRKGGVIVGGLQEETVGNSKDIFSLLERGSTKRRSAQTILHSQSSRSHSLFFIKIHIKEATLEGKEKVGKLNLVDLAGSENIFRSGATEGRAREAGEINKSLLTLTRVIKALVNHSPHVPYRDSKLTRLLRDSLGGKTKTCIIATVSPAVLCLEQTLSTLDYAEQARNIKNKPEVNQKMMKASSHFPPSQTSKLLEKTQEVCVLTADMEKSEKAALDLKKKVVDSMAVFVSYIEGVQNIVRLHSAGGSAALDELSALASSISLPIGEILGAEDANMNSLFDDLQQSLSSHQGEVFDLVKEFRQSLNASMEHAINISNSLLGFIEKLSEEQSRTDAQKLNADVTILVSDCMGRQREMTPLQPTASPLQPTASPLQPTASPHRRGFHIRTPVKIRRLKRRWSKEEEEGLRIGVSEYETRWGTILQTYPDIFVGRTQCDLKDKWRNMMKKKK